MKRLKISIASFLMLLSVGCASSEVHKDSDHESIDKDIHKTVKQHFDEIKLCYEATQERLPNFAGKLTLQFTVTTQGEAKNISPMKESSSITDSRFINCVTDAIATWQFPARPAETEVHFPFLIRSKAETEAAENEE